MLVLRSSSRLLARTAGIRATPLLTVTAPSVAHVAPQSWQKQGRTSVTEQKRQIHQSAGLYEERASTIKVETNTSKQKSAGFARRSMLYVPGSSDKMIKKSQQSKADCLIFDLEDSVAQHRKGAARESVLHGLNASPRPGPELAVRINPPSSARTLANDDLDVILPCKPLNTIVVPKVESLDDTLFILDKIQLHRTSGGEGFSPLTLVLSIESANSLLRMSSIVEQFATHANERGLDGVVHVGALLFASEDYCASTGIIRSKSRKELLFPRAHMATIAKAYALQAIDMVCIDYKDMAYLDEESTEGRSMGYDGKQAIHPAQVDAIQRAFSPSEKDVERAAKIKFAYEQSVLQDKGAVGFVEGDSMIMIDAPMLKQADVVLAKAQAAGVAIPDVSATQTSGA